MRAVTARLSLTALSAQVASATVLALLSAPQAFAAATLTPATTSIASSTAANALGTYTTLIGPVISAIDNNDMSTENAGSIVFTAPSGFEFDTGGVPPTVLVTCTSQCGTGATNNINNLASGNSINGASITVTAMTLTVTITDDVDNTGGNTQ